MFLIVRSKDQIRKTERFFKECNIEHASFAISSIQLNKLKIDKDVDGFIVTSQNAVLSIPQTKLPFFCVGEATEKECLETGRRVAYCGKMDAKSMAEDMAKTFPPMKLIHAAGDMAETDWYTTLEAKGISVEKHIAYETIYTKELLPEVKNLIKSGVLKGVVLFSVQGAQKFLDLLQSENMDYSNLHAVTFSQNIADICTGFKQVHVTASPSLNDVKNIIQSL